MSSGDELFAKERKQGRGSSGAVGNVAPSGGPEEAVERSLLSLPSGKPIDKAQRQEDQRVALRLLNKLSG